MSPWLNPLPLGEYTTNRVEVYFVDSGRWIGIKSCSLIEARVLQRQALLYGLELFIFPPDCEPATF
jgi:hypothetical protein